MTAEDVSLADGLSAELTEFADYCPTEPTSADGFCAWLDRAR
jgi:hypothetical protein